MTWRWSPQSSIVGPHSSSIGSIPIGDVSIVPPQKISRAKTFCPRRQGGHQGDVRHFRMHLEGRDLANARRAGAGHVDFEPSTRVNAYDSDYAPALNERS